MRDDALCHETVGRAHEFRLDLAEVAIAERQLIRLDRDRRQRAWFDSGARPVVILRIAGQQQPLGLHDDRLPGVEVIGHVDRAEYPLAFEIDEPLVGTPIHADPVIDEVLAQDMQVGHCHIDRPDPLRHADLALGIFGEIEPVLRVDVAGLAAQVQAARLGFILDRADTEPRDAPVEVPGFVLQERQLP